MDTKWVGLDTFLQGFKTVTSIGDICLTFAAAEETRRRDFIQFPANKKLNQKQRVSANYINSL